MKDLTDLFTTIWHYGNGVDRIFFILLVAVIVLNILRIALLVYETFFSGTDDDSDNLEDE